MPCRTDLRGGHGFERKTLISHEVASEYLRMGSGVRDYYQVASENLQTGSPVLLFRHNYLCAIANYEPVSCNSFLGR